MNIHTLELTNWGGFFFFLMGDTVILIRAFGLVHNTFRIQVA